MTEKTKAEQIRNFNSDKANPGGVTPAGKVQGSTSVPASQELPQAEQQEQQLETPANVIAASNATHIEETPAQKQARAEREAIEQRRGDRVVQRATQNVVDGINSTIDPMKERLASAPSPGGIMSLIAFIIFFAFIGVPVNDKGQTRAYLLWRTLNGGTHLQYTTKSSTGGGADFNNAVNPAVTQVPTAMPSVDLSHLNLFDL